VEESNETQVVIFYYRLNTAVFISQYLCRAKGSATTDQPARPIGSFSSINLVCHCISESHLGIWRFCLPPPA